MSRFLHRDPEEREEVIEYLPDTSEGESEKQMMIELMVGTIIVGVIVQCGILCFLSEKLFLSIGLWLGVTIGCGMIWHMNRAIEEGVELGKDGAITHIRKQYLIRTLVVAVIFGLVFYLQIGSALTMFIGIMGLKVAAYQQPLLHKWLQKIK